MEKRDTTRVTLEAAAYAGVALLAAGLRWPQLGLQPLGASEATLALAAYRFVHGTASAAPAGTLPALFAGNVAGFTLLGTGDSVVRWLPALMGTILALLPCGLRRWLGRGGALAASVFLAISPSAIYFSRTLDGSILVATCGLALVVGLLQYLKTRRPGAMYLAAGATGLGLCAGSAFLTMLLILASFVLPLYLAARLLNRHDGWETVRQAWQALAESRGTAIRAGCTLVAVFGLVATTFGLYPGGVSHAVDLIGDWVLGFVSQSGGQPFSYPLLLLVRYEPLILVLGLVAMAGTAARIGKARSTEAREPDPDSQIPRFPATAFLTYWSLVAILVAVVSGHRPAGNILLAVAPLGLLAGQTVERAGRRVSRQALWRAAGAVTAVVLVLGVFLYLQITAFALSDNVSTVSFAGMALPTGTAYALLALLALVLLVGLGAVAWIWRGRETMVAGGWLALVMVLGVWGLRSAWGLSHTHAADPRELMIGQTTAPDVRTLVQQMERLSLDYAGDAHTLPVTVDAATGPVVTWYLREFGRQDVVEELVTPPATSVAVTLARQELPIGEAFTGTAFPLHISWKPSGLGSKGVLGWLLFGSGSLPTVDQQVVLWVATQAIGK